MDHHEGALAAESAGITLEQHNAAIAKAKADGKAEGVSEGRKTAHDRIAAIAANEKVKGKETTALDLALKSPDMGAEDVVAFVAALPAAQAPASVPTIEERMKGQGADLALGGPITHSQGFTSSDLWSEAAAKTNAQFGSKR